MSNKIRLTSEDIKTLCEKLVDAYERDEQDFQILLNESRLVLFFEVVCDECLGEGEVSTDVDDGEGHTMRGVGTEKCSKCSGEGDDHDDMDDDSDDLGGGGVPVFA